MSTREFFGLQMFNKAPFGVYAVDLSQTICYWNSSAERITGRRSEEVIGRFCYQALHNVSQGDKSPVCQNGCLSLEAVRAGRIPEVHQVRMLCASGESKLVNITPLLATGAELTQPVMIHFFHEIDDEANAARIAENVESGPSQKTALKNIQITERELEILRLVAMGLRPQDISDKLHISYNTVRNHIANMRRKVGARNRLDLVIDAQNLGII